MTNVNIEVVVHKLLEAIRDNYDEPMEAALDVKQEVDHWLDGFYGECPGCHREPRYCCCP